MNWLMFVSFPVLPLIDTEVDLSACTDANRLKTQLPSYTLK